MWGGTYSKIGFEPSRMSVDVGYGPPKLTDFGVPGQQLKEGLL